MNKAVGSKGWALFPPARANECVRESDFVMRVIDDRRRLDEEAMFRAERKSIFVAASFFAIGCLIALKYCVFWADEVGVLRPLGLVVAIAMAAAAARSALRIYKLGQARSSNYTMLVLRQGILRKRWTDVDEGGSNFFVPWSTVQDVREEEDGVTLVLRGLPPIKIPASSIPWEWERGILVTLARSWGELPKVVRRSG